MAVDPMVAAELVHTPVEVLRQMFEHRLWLRDEVVPALDAEIARRGLSAEVIDGRWELVPLRRDTVQAIRARLQGGAS